MYNFSKEQTFCEGELIVVAKEQAIRPLQMHTHDFIEIVYIISGSGVQQINSNQYSVSSGSLLFINYGQTHAFYSDSGMTYFNILVQPEAVSNKIINSENAFEILSLTAFEDFRAVDTSCQFVTFEGSERFKIENVISEMYFEYIKKPRGSSVVLKGYLTVLLAYIFRSMVPGSDSFDIVPLKITEYIQKHFNEKLTLELLAEKCFYSPKYFSRIFKECYGITVTEYIQKKRLDEGMRLLAETSHPIDEISRMVGYDDSVRFYKYFKKMCGMTPKEYRNYAKSEICKTKKKQNFC